MTKQIEITAFNVYFTVEYSVFGSYKESTYWEPAEYPELEIEAILICDQDVTDIITQIVYDTVVQKVKENIDMGEMYVL